MKKIVCVLGASLGLLVIATAGFCKARQGGEEPLLITLQRFIFGVLNNQPPFKLSGYKASDELLEVLQKYANEHHTSLEDAIHLTCNLVGNNRGMLVKSGYGTLGPDLSVSVFTSTNVILLSDNRHIELGEAKSTRLVIFAGDRMVQELKFDHVNREELKFVLFSPEKVQFFDWGRLVGGYYERDPSIPFNFE